jgi:hypothetical protein
MGRGPSGTISIVDRDKTVTTLTKEFASLRGLAWSSDREVWFAAADNDKSNRALRAVTLKGKERVVFEAPGALTLWDLWSDGRVLLTLDEERRAVMALAPGESVPQDVSWLDKSGLAAISQDGRWLLCGDRNWVFLRATDGSQLRLLLQGASADDLASDGETLLATKDATLVILRPGVSVPQPLPPGGIVTNRGGYWFPRSGTSRVLFTGQREGELQRSFIQDVTGGPPTPITPEGFWGVAISQDDQWIAATKGSGPPIQIVPVNGVGKPRIVPGVQEGERPVAFSQDGNAVWVFRRSRIPGNVASVDIATGRRLQEKVLDPPDRAGVYSIVDVAITPSGNAYAYSYNRVLSQLYLVTGLK